MPAVRQETGKAEINTQGSEVNENFSFVIPFFAQISIFPNAMAGQNYIGLFNILVSSTKAGRFAYAKVVFLAMKQMWFDCLFVGFFFVLNNYDICYHYNHI